jgi:hypothetical protein
MKLIKLMTVTALTVGAVFGSFVESAEARGGRWSGNSINEVDLDFKFSLFTETPDGEPILDSSPSRVFCTRFRCVKRDLSPNLGIFEEAIRDLSYTAAEENGSFLVSGKFDLLDLRARKRGEIVEYSFLIPNKNIEVFPINIFSFDFQISLDFLEETLQELDLDLDLDPVNSLEDIFTLFNERDDEGELLLQRLLKQQNRTVSISVPESSSINSLLAISILGAGLGLKRKLK